MAKKKGLELLYNLLLKDAAKESGKRSGIAQIGNVTRDIAEKKFQAFVLGARKQGVDLDNYTEQQFKYIIQLNKPKPLKVISADSPEGRGITKALLGKRGQVIEGKFGKPFAKEVEITKQQKMVDGAIDNSSPGFSGDTKYDAQLVAEDLAEKMYGKEFYDLSQKQQSDVYGKAYDGLTKQRFKGLKKPEPEDKADGGRIGYKIGSIDKGRRAFLKLMGGAAAGIGALKTGALKMFGKEGVKNLPPIKTPVTKLEGTTTQMPDWFPSFINKFRDEGKATNVFKKEKVKVSKAEYDKAIAEGKSENYYRDDARTPEYKANNPDHMDYFKLEETDERIFTTYTNDKVPGVRVDDMDGNVDVMFQNDYSQPVSMNYTAPGKKGPETGRADLFVQGESKIETKPKGEFVANDVEVYATDPDGGFDTEDVIANTVDDMLEGKTRQMEEYATGKKTKMSSGEFRIGQAEARAEQAAEEAAEAADDFASGGLAGMLGE